MKISILKRKRKTEVINRVELADLAQDIRNGKMDKEVKYHREIYHTRE